MKQVAILSVCVVLFLGYYVGELEKDNRAWRQAAEKATQDLWKAKGGSEFLKPPSPFSLDVFKSEVREAAEWIEGGNKVAAENDQFKEVINRFYQDHVADKKQKANDPDPLTMGYVDPSFLGIIFTEHCRR